MASISVKSKVQLTPLEHKLYRELRALPISNQGLLVAVSGGLDSIALLKILHNLEKLLSVKIFAAHIHHGKIKGSQGEFRDLAFKKVKKVCKSLKVPFYTNSENPKEELKSEDELRKFRYGCFEKIKHEVKSEHGFLPFVVTAHTANDLLETRMIRLIRGTGIDGLESMRVFDAHKIRPLLETTRSELEAYAKSKRISWLEDPSNKKVDPLRNWMRQRWLPQLEKKREGSLKSLARSLSLVLEGTTEKSEDRFGTVWSKDGVHCGPFLELNDSEKRQVLAQYMRRLNVKNYTLNHINEILKRLDNSRSEHNFTILKHEWCVNREQILARPIV